MEFPELIVFDMIGTTVRGADFLPSAFRKAFETVGVNLSDDDISAARGKSKREAISGMLFESVGAKKAGEVAMSVYDAFESTLLQQYWDTTIKPVTGTRETFDWCRENRIRIALGTGFERRLAEVLIQKLEWQDDVDILVCNDDVARGRPAPYLIFHAMEKALVKKVSAVATVGDSVADLQAGANAGLGWSIGVVSGSTRRKALKAEPHTAILRSVAELPGLFEADD